MAGVDPLVAMVPALSGNSCTAASSAEVRFLIMDCKRASGQRIRRAARMQRLTVQFKGEAVGQALLLTRKRGGSCIDRIDVRIYTDFLDCSHREDCATS